MSNPFREDLVFRSQVETCTVVIFGATGDLTHRKLIPAMYNLAIEGELSPGVKILGFARREKSDEEFRAGLKELNKEVSRSGHDEQVWDEFEQNIHYHQSEFQDEEGYQSLSDRLDQIDLERGAKGNRLFYIASAPEYFDDILLNLKKVNLNESAEGCWSRVVVEKPFGTDLATAEHLNTVVNETFEEKDTYRIDHYLGKETAQNIMVLRFANSIFEPLWNNKYIEQVQITCSEHLGMEGGRGGYYDKSGALRDMVQNHLLQLLSLVAMEPPTSLSADGVRDEKVKVIRSLRKFDTPEKVKQNVVRAQYSKGYIGSKDVVSYREEDRVNPESNTESYTALRLHVDTWRWSGVPFYMRVGKRLPKKATEISIHFKDAPNVLFNALAGSNPGGNVLVIRIQPDEGISLKMTSKSPGTTLRLEPVKMNFQYSSSFGKGSPEAYERLLLDSMAGDATLFARRDEVEEAWRFVDHIEHAWHGDDQPEMAEYVAGSWGPKEADDLLEEDGFSWRRL